MRELGFRSREEVAPFWKIVQVVRLQVWCLVFGNWSLVFGVWVFCCLVFWCLVLVAGVRDRDSGFTD